MKIIRNPSRYLYNTAKLISESSLLSSCNEYIPLYSLGDCKIKKVHTSKVVISREYMYDFDIPLIDTRRKISFKTLIETFNGDLIENNEVPAKKDNNLFFYLGGAIIWLDSETLEHKILAIRCVHRDFVEKITNRESISTKLITIFLTHDVAEYLSTPIYNKLFRSLIEKTGAGTGEESEVRIVKVPIDFIIFNRPKITVPLSSTFSEMSEKISNVGNMLLKDGIINYP